MLRHRFLFAIVFCFVLWRCVQPPTSTQPDRCDYCTTAVVLDSGNFDRLVSAAPVAMVEFYLPWCHDCFRMEPVIESLAVSYSGRVLVGKLDHSEDTSVGRRFGVASVPAFRFFRNGIEQPPLRRSGLQSRDTLSEILDKLLE